MVQNAGEFASKQAFIHVQSHTLQENKFIYIYIYII